MSSNEELGDFEIDEPEGVVDSNSYGGEIEVWEEPFKVGLRGSDIPQLGYQAPSKKSYARKIKIRWQAGTEEIVMRCILAWWLMILFNLCLCIGVVIYITSRSSGILLALLSGTGMFAILLGIVYAYYFRRSKK